MAGLGAPLAVGATARPTVNTRLRGSGTPSLSLVSASPSVMVAHEHTITGVSPGVSAMMMAMKDGAVIDFVHVWVEAATRLQLHRLAADGSDLGEITDVVELVEGEDIRIAPRPYAGAQRLMGEGPAAWRVDPPLAAVLRDGTPGRRRLVARTPGAATVTIDSLGLKSTLQIVVHESGRAAKVLAAQPAAPESEAGPAEEADAAADEEVKR